MTESQVSVDIDAVDFFTDNTLLHDPYEYLAAVRNALGLAIAEALAARGKSVGNWTSSQAQRRMDVGNDLVTLTSDWTRM